MLVQYRSGHQRSTTTAFIPNPSPTVFIHLGIASISKDKGPAATPSPHPNSTPSLSPLAVRAQELTHGHHATKTLGPAHLQLKIVPRGNRVVIAYSLDEDVDCHSITVSKALSTSNVSFDCL